MRHIGELELRLEAPFQGLNKEGKFFLFQIIPNSQTTRWFGEYLYAKVSDPECIEQQDHRWKFRHFNEEFRTITADNNWLHIPQQLKEFAESLAGQHGYDVLIRVKREDINPYPGSKEAVVRWFEISVFKLPKIKNVQDFIDCLCRLIDLITMNTTV
jgi:hypothetical protein